MTRITHLMLTFIETSAGKEYFYVFIYLSEDKVSTRMVVNLEVMQIHFAPDTILFLVSVYCSVSAMIYSVVLAHLFDKYSLF